MAKMIERDLAYAETAPVIAEGSAVIDGTPEEVWAVLVDHRRWPEWFEAVKRCEPTSEAESGVGMTRRATIAGGGHVDERFLAWDEGELWAFTGTAGRPGAFKSLVERAVLEPVGPDRTRITYRMAFEPAALLKPLVPLLRKQISGQLAKAMAGLGREVAARR